MLLGSKAFCMCILSMQSTMYVFVTQTFLVDSIYGQPISVEIPSELVIKSIWCREFFYLLKEASDRNKMQNIYIQNAEGFELNLSSRLLNVDVRKSRKHDSGSKLCLLVPRRL